MIYKCAISTDIGVEREKMEDYAAFVELDDENLFCIIADGTGSRDNCFQPAMMISTDIAAAVQSFFNDRKETFLNDPEYFIKRFMFDANRMIGAFHVANEELYSGYAASVTCCLFSFSDNTRMMYGASCGNTRLYVIRNGKLNRITNDDTVAYALFREGRIDSEAYHTDPKRLEMTSGIGLVSNPEIETFGGKLRPNDVVLMTTDGIHYALKPEPLAEILLKAGEPLASCQALISAAKDVVKYPDNMAAMIIA